MKIPPILQALIIFGALPAGALCALLLGDPIAALVFNVVMAAGVVFLTWRRSERQPS